MTENAPETRQSDWPSPGQKLKALREDLGLSHARVADALHMTAHYVKALENDQYEKLPGKTFVKGYFRAYAKFLGADVEDIMQCYQHFVAAMEESEVSEANVIRARKAYDQNVRWLITAAVIIVVVIGVSWWFASKDEDSAAVATGTRQAIADTGEGNEITTTGALPGSGNARESQIPVETAVIAQALETLARHDPEPPGTGAAIGEEAGVDYPGSDYPGSGMQTLAEIEDGNVATDAGQVSEQPSGPTVDDTATVEITSLTGLPDYTVTRIDDHRLVRLDSEGQDTLDVHFSGASWIEIDNADDARLYHDMLRTGDELSIRGKAPFNILIGDANMVDITFNSRQVQVSRIRPDNSARILLEPETR